MTFVQNFELDTWLLLKHVELHTWLLLKHFELDAWLLLKHFELDAWLFETFWTWRMTFVQAFSTKYFELDPWLLFKHLSESIQSGQCSILAFKKLLFRMHCKRDNEKGWEQETLFLPARFSYNRKRCMSSKLNSSYSGWLSVDPSEENHFDPETTSDIGTEWGLQIWLCV